VSEDYVPGRRLLLASPRGFCAGVERAVATVEQALHRHGRPVYVRHQIVHNAYVVSALERKGAVFVEDLRDVPRGAVVVFSAHGVSPAIHAEAAVRELRPVDATCPLVTKVHKEAVKFAEDGYDILLVGHAGHEEVIGTTGHAPDRIQVVDGPGAVDTIRVRDEQKVAWLSQTTLSVEEAMATATALKQRFPALVSPPSDDICYATQNRQNAVKLLAAESDLVMVIGSRNSSNSVRLVEVALAEGAAGAYLIGGPDDIQERWLRDVSTVGVTSGASAPEVLVRGVVEHLFSAGFTDLHTVGSVTETQHFVLPRSLLKRGRRRSSMLLAHRY
jgi:4-hydroxy-3-methylbut-2-en-1-yl diphosphate reductase